MAEKKKSGKSMFVVLLLLLVIVIVLFLLFSSGGLGFGNGFGTDSGNNNQPDFEQSISDVSENQESDAETDSFAVTDFVSEVVTETEMLVFDVTVMGSMYLYQNQEILLDDFLSEIQSQQVYFMVRVTDDNATQNAMEDLMTALQDAEITYALD